MKERPVNMRAQEVRAILAGKKTQFRRVVKWPLLSKSDGSKKRMLLEADAPLLVEILKENTRRHPHLQFRQLGQPGDRLWVRETWAPHADMPRAAIYRCDPGGDYQDNSAAFRWRPSVHMPRALSRITLKVVSVRVESLNDISEEDAIAEGVEIKQDARIAAYVAQDSPGRMEFWCWWSSIYGPEDWTENPWVWAVQFKVVGGGAK